MLHEGQVCVCEAVCACSCQLVKRGCGNGSGRSNKLHNFDIDAQIFTKCCGKVGHEQLSNCSYHLPKRGCGSGSGLWGSIAQHQNNRSFYDESTKFGRSVDRYMSNKTGYWDITNSHPGGRGSHFSKWPPAVDQSSYCLS